MIAMVTIMLTLSAMVLPNIPSEFVPATDEGQFLVDVRFSGDASLTKVETTIEQVEKVLGRHPAMTSFFSATDPLDSTHATVLVRLSKSGRPSQNELMAQAREALAAFDCRIRVDAVPRLSGGGLDSAPVQYVLSGSDLERLNAFASRMVADLSATPGFVDVATSTDMNRRELQVLVDRERGKRSGHQHVGCQRNGQSTRWRPRGLALPRSRRERSHSNTARRHRPRRSTRC